MSTLLKLVYYDSYAVKSVILTYPGTDTSAASGDFEISIEILDGTSCKKSFHHQQNAINKEGSCYSIDHIFENVNPAINKIHC